MLTRFETSVFWTLHTHLHQFNIFPYRMSTLPLFSSFCSSSFSLVLSFVSQCILVSFTFFAIFIFIFSWSWIVSLTLFFCFLLFTKTTIVFFFSQKNTILFVSFLVGHVSQLFSCFVLFFCLEKWFLVFVLTLLFFSFSSFFSAFSFSFITFLFWCIWKMLFFSNKLEKTSSVFSLSAIYLFFFFCSLVFV